MHWINVAVMLVMITSGRGIYDDDVIIRGFHFSCFWRLGDWAAWSLNWHFAGMRLLVMICRGGDTLASIRLSSSAAHGDQAGIQKPQVDHRNRGDEHLSRRILGRERLPVVCRFAARGGGLRGGDSGVFISRKPDRRFLIRPCQPQRSAGDVILLVRRQSARRRAHHPATSSFEECSTAWVENKPQRLAMRPNLRT